MAKACVAIQWKSISFYKSENKHNKIDSKNHTNSTTGSIFGLANSSRLKMNLTWHETVILWNDSKARLVHKVLHPSQKNLFGYGQAWNLWARFLRTGTRYRYNIRLSISGAVPVVPVLRNLAHKFYS